MDVRRPLLLFFGEINYGFTYIPKTQSSTPWITLLAALSSFALVIKAHFKSHTPVIPDPGRTGTGFLQ